MRLLAGNINYICVILTQIRCRRLEFSLVENSYLFFLHSENYIADERVLHGAKASVTIGLTYTSRNIPTLVPDTELIGTVMNTYALKVTMDLYNDNNDF